MKFLIPSSLYFPIALCEFFDTVTTYLAETCGRNEDMYRNKVILAPMVKIGTLAFRLLALDYGADLVYSEEIIDWKLLRCKRVLNDRISTIEYIDVTDDNLVFSTCSREKDKVILQIGTSDPGRALKVVKMMEKDVAGIDINMGCPKEFSLKGGMGAALLRKPEKIRTILTTLVNNATIPITCKIRVFDSIEESIKLAKLIESCGVSAVAVHGRTINERRQHANRNHFIKAISASLSIPVIANGVSKETKSYEDISKFKIETGCSSIMFARAAEWNSSIFSSETIKEDIHVLIKKFLQLGVFYGIPFTFVKYTIQNILREQQVSELGKKFLGSQHMMELCELWNLSDFYKLHIFKVGEDYNRRALLAEDSEKNQSFPRKKLKSSLLDLYKPRVLPGCYFFRGKYGNPEILPKTILVNWLRQRKLPVAKYTTECCDKKFRSIVNVNGNCYATDVWEKCKKFAEQAAALAALKGLEILE